MCEFLLGCRILAVIAFNVFIHLKLLDGRKRIEVNWKILQADIQLYTKLTSCLKQLLTLYHRITFCMSQVHFFSLKQVDTVYFRKKKTTRRKHHISTQSRPPSWDQFIYFKNYHCQLLFCKMQNVNICERKHSVFLPRKTWVQENFGRISKSRKRF